MQQPHTCRRPPFREKCFSLVRQPLDHFKFSRSQSCRRLDFWHAHLFLRISGNFWRWQNSLKTPQQLTYDFARCQVWVAVNQFLRLSCEGHTAAALHFVARLLWNVRQSHRFKQRLCGNPVATVRFPLLWKVDPLRPPNTPRRDFNEKTSLKVI